MSDVGSWSPPPKALGDQHRKVLHRLSGCIAGDVAVDTGGDGAATLAVDEADAVFLREFMTAPSSTLAAFIADVPSPGLVSWIRIATLAEALPGGEVGAKSPVIAMARELKARGDYPETLSKWIKANTTNRFLPHGSLMDRL